MSLVKNINFRVILLIFLIGCFVGYIYEFLFYLIIDKVVINSGFLYGPYLPVYGFGSVFIYLFLKRFRNKPVLMFIMSMLITGIVEYITGYTMLKIWNRRWWDYTGLFLNLDGFICLRSLISFSIGAFILIYFIEPIINKNLDNIYKYGKYIILL